jgi:hypothetical protein
MTLQEVLGGPGATEPKSYTPQSPTANTKTTNQMPAPKKSNCRTSPPKPPLSVKYPTSNTLLTTAYTVKTGPVPHPSHHLMNSTLTPKNLKQKSMRQWPQPNPPQSLQHQILPWPRRAARSKVVSAPPPSSTGPSTTHFTAISTIEHTNKINNPYQRRVTQPRKSSRVQLLPKNPPARPTPSPPRTILSRHQVAQLNIENNNNTNMGDVL